MYTCTLFYFYWYYIIYLCVITVTFLQCNGQNIDWQLLIELYKANAGRASETPGVSIVHKLKCEHLHLTNFSKMQVDLAVQVKLC